MPAPIQRLLTFYENYEKDEQESFFGGDYHLDTKDLMQRYKISLQGIRDFVTRHIEKINADGVEHARQTKNGWQFDAEAVRIIDELRGFSQVAIVEVQESEKIKEMQTEIENLKNLLLISQSKLIQTQEQLQANQKELFETKTKLLESENRANEKNLDIVKMQADLKVTESKVELEKKLRQIAEKSVSDVNQRLSDIKNRGFLDRVLNRFE